VRIRDIPGEDPWRSGAISTASWIGVSLADVLAEAGLRPEAAHVSFAAPDVAAPQLTVDAYDWAPRRSSGRRGGVKEQAIICAASHRTRGGCAVPGMEVHIVEGQVRNAMIRHCVHNPRAGVVVNMRRLTFTALTVVISGAIAWSPATAHAETIPQGFRASAGDHGPISIGNGKHNITRSQIGTSTIIRGVQNVDISTITGDVSSQSAFCKRGHRVCHISQKHF
jgi:hypothetical protein